MSTNTAFGEIPNTADLINIGESLGGHMERLYEFLNTHPTPVKIIQLIQGLLSPFR